MNESKLTREATGEEPALLPEMAAQFEGHLGTCPGCTAYLQQMQQTINLLLV